MANVKHLPKYTQAKERLRLELGQRAFPTIC